MVLPRGPCVWISVAAGVLAGGVVAVRAWAIEPSLTFSTRLSMQTSSEDIWVLRVGVRGGGPVASASIDAPAAVNVFPARTYGPFLPDREFEFTLDIPRTQSMPFVVQVREEPSGRVTPVTIGDAK